MKKILLQVFKKYPVYPFCETIYNWTLIHDVDLSFVEIFGRTTTLMEAQSLDETTLYTLAYLLIYILRYWISHKLTGLLVKKWNSPLSPTDLFPYIPLLYEYTYSRGQSIFTKSVWVVNKYQRVFIQKKDVDLFFVPKKRNIYSILFLYIMP